MLSYAVFKIFAFMCPVYISYADLMRTVNMQSSKRVNWKRTVQYDLTQHQQLNLSTQVYIDKTKLQLNVNYAYPR